MGNRFNIQKANKTLKISNGGTDVLFDVLLIGASKLAVSQWEKNFAFWLAGIDPDKVLLGTIGFDIDDFGWTKADFEQQKEFVLRVIDEAADESNYTVLSYRPNIAEKLQGFRELVDAYEKRYVENEEWAGNSWFEKGDEYTLCPIHKIYRYKSKDTCRICIP